MDVANGKWKFIDTVQKEFTGEKALTPVLTIFGLDVGLLLGGAVLTEKTFSLNGLGKYGYDAIVQGDLPKILGVTLVAGFFVIIANLIVDLLYGVIDPRVRLE